MIEQSFTSLMAAEPTQALIRQERFTYLNLDEDSQGNTVLPGQTLHVVASPQDPSLDDDGPQRMRLEIDHWAKDAFTALTLREACRVFLNGLVNQQLSDGTVLQWCEYIGPMDFYDNDAEAFRCASEWYLHFNFPAPADPQE